VLHFENIRFLLGCWNESQICLEASIQGLETSEFVTFFEIKKPKIGCSIDTF